jgi:hypothetical protein
VFSRTLNIPKNLLNIEHKSNSFKNVPQKVEGRRNTNVQKHRRFIILCFFFFLV